MSNGGNGSGSARSDAESFELKIGLAEMLKGGVIMDVTKVDEAKIAEDAGAVAVMALPSEKTSPSRSVIRVPPWSLPGSSLARVG